MIYVWQSKKGRKYHIATEKGTLCKFENGVNGAKYLTEWSENIPEKRKMCSICQYLQAGRSKKKQPKQYKPHTKSSRKASNGNFYQSWEWKKARFETIKRYGPVCMCCGSDHHIVVDHIKPRRKYPELELSLDNLQVLCNDCNQGKAGDDETDFRPKGLSAGDIEELALIYEANQHTH